MFARRLLHHTRSTNALLRTQGLRSSCAQGVLLRGATRAYTHVPNEALMGKLTKSQIMEGVSVPFISPSYPKGPYRFINREYMIVVYETCREELRKVVPEPLVPNASNHVLYEWINMPDSSGGFGSYCESGAVIPCTYNGEEVNFTLEMYLDCEPPIAGGREIWGFPKKRGEPRMKVTGDTWTGNLKYSNQLVSMGTMVYKQTKIDKEDAIKALSKKNVNLKIIPDVDWSPKIAQLVSYRLCDINLKEAWQGPARLHLVPHINCPPADLPIKKVIGGKYYLADITLPYGEVLHDYLDPNQVPIPAAKKEKGGFTVDQILNTVSMPAVSPSYKKGPSHLQDREYLVIKYKTDADAIRRFVPDILEVNPDNEIMIEWVRTSGTGLGSYDKCSVLIPCKYNGLEGDFLVQSYCDLEAPITAGREVWGQPHKFADPNLEVTSDTVSAELIYAGEQVAVASMNYKSERMQAHHASQLLARKQLNLKLIPNVDGSPKIVQLVGINHEDIVIREAWSGSARLSLVPHINAPLADFPMLEIGKAYHIFVNSMLLPAGEVLHDYIAQQ